MVSFYLSKVDVSRVYVGKLGNKNFNNVVKIKLLTWNEDLGMDNQLTFLKRCCCKKPLSF